MGLNGAFLDYFRKLTGPRMTSSLTLQLSSNGTDCPNRGSKLSITEASGGSRWPCIGDFPATTVSPMSGAQQRRLGGRRSRVPALWDIYSEAHATHGACDAPCRTTAWTQADSSTYDLNHWSQCMKHVCFFIGDIRPCPSPLSLLCEASHNAWPAISIYWRSEPAPLSFENSFLNCTLHSLSGKPGKFIVQDFVSNVTLRDQFKPKLQLFFPRWLQSGMEPALLSHSNRTVAGHGCPGRPHLPAPSSPSQPSPCCDLWPCDKALAKGMWVTAVCICPSGPQLWPHSSFPRDPPSSQSTVARATAVTSPVNSPLLQIIRPHPRPTEWETLFLGPSSHFTCTSASAAGDPYATPSLSTTAVRTPASTRMTARPQVEEQCVERSTGVCMTRCCITLHQSRPFAPKLLHEKKKLS